MRTNSPEAREQTSAAPLPTVVERLEVVAARLERVAEIFDGADDDFDLEEVYRHVDESEDS